MPEGSKQDEIVEILDWYRSGARGRRVVDTSEECLGSVFDVSEKRLGRRVVDIADDRVFFFDDKAGTLPYRDCWKSSVTRPPLTTRVFFFDRGLVPVHDTSMPRPF